jgi:hypothetical protein
MDEQRIRKRIAVFAQSPKNVRFDDLVSLLDNHISRGYSNYNHRDSGSHHAFTVGDQTFNVVKPQSGCIKRIYVEKFLDAMEELLLYDPEKQP